MVLWKFHQAFIHHLATKFEWAGRYMQVTGMVSQSDSWCKSGQLSYIFFVLLVSTITKTGRGTTDLTPNHRGVDGKPYYISKTHLSYMCHLAGYLHRNCGKGVCWS